MTASLICFGFKWHIIVVIIVVIVTAVAVTVSAITLVIIIVVYCDDIYRCGCYCGRSQYYWLVNIAPCFST